MELLPCIFLVKRVGTKSMSSTQTFLLFTFFVLFPGVGVFYEYGTISEISVQRIDCDYICPIRKQVA